tara:strand:- start:19017 stop:21284 length:2268 start_codon:yes stop_codon:yes gene_type:complete
MRKLLGLVLLLASGSASAQSMFDIPLTDVSRIYLNTIFGTVGNVLSGGGSQLLKEAFSYFNSAVLVLGGIIIIYSLIVSTVNTSHDGEMLGKKWNSVWIPLRSAVGFGLLLPVKAGGYAVIQVMVMYVVLQGVGAANYIWSNTLDYIGTGGNISTTQTPSTFFQLAGKAFSNWVCAYEGAKYVNQQYGRTNAQASSSISNYTILMQFTGSGQGTCGSVLLKLPTSSEPLSPADQSTNNAIIATVQQLAIPGKMFVDDYPSEPNANTIIQLIRNAANNYYLQQQEAQRRASMQYGTGSMRCMPVFSNMFDPTSGKWSCTRDDFVNQAIQVGWIFAGSYFLQITQSIDQSREAAYAFPVNGPNTGKLINIFGQDNDIITVYNAAEKFQTSNVDPSHTQIDIDITSPSGVNSILYSIFNPAFSAWKKYLKAQAKDMDNLLAGNFEFNPIAELHALGTQMISGIEIAWLAFGGIVVGAGALAFIDSCMMPFSYMAQTGLMIFMPLVTMSAAVIFPSAGMLAYYVPLMPFIIFTVGAVGWFILVIEAMAAAPILALGILHPEGQHEVYGKAEPGIYLLINVFLRPPLMIIGLFAAYLLMFAAVSLVNVAFLMLTGGFENKGAFDISIVGMSMLLGVYALVLLTVIQKCFGLIHMVPDRVMRWIGQHDQYAGAYGAEQDMQGFKQAAQGAGEQASKGTSESIGGTAGKVGKGVQTAAQKKHETAAKGKRFAEHKHGSGKGGGSIGSGPGSDPDPDPGSDPD